MERLGVGRIVVERELMVVQLVEWLFVELQFLELQFVELQFVELELMVERVLAVGRVGGSTGIRGALACARRDRYLTESYSDLPPEPLRRG